MYDCEEEMFSENKFIDILNQIDLDVLMIVHQKETLSSSNKRKYDVNTLETEKFNELLYLDYFEAFEYKNKRNEIFNKDYIYKNINSDYKNIKFITGSDCHDWSTYPSVDGNFSFSYIKCLPTFKGLAMAFTSKTRIKTVNSFFSSSEKTVDTIDININDKKYKIELSKGINAIIGENSIGKSLLIHKLCDYKYVTSTSRDLLDGYNKYLNANCISIDTKIDDTNIYKFDGQGNIRKQFENGDTNSISFLKTYFPVDPNVKDLKLIVKLEIAKYIECIKNKKELYETKNKISNLQYKEYTDDAQYLTISLVSDNYINNYKSIQTNYQNIIQYIDDVIRNIDLLLKNNYFMDEDKEKIKENLNKFNNLKQKYELCISKVNHGINKIFLVNNILQNKINELSNFKTSNAKDLEIYNNQKISFKNNIIDYWIASTKVIDYKPNIETVYSKTNLNVFGKYNFISKTKIEKISNDYINKCICSIIGAKYKDPNELDPFNLPDRFNVTKGEKTEFLSKIEKIKDEILAKVDEDFKIENIINTNENDITEKLSNGLNSSIYLDLISKDNRKQGIYIIDQPEDDVSQKNIKNGLISNFQEMSNYRQILMITHNSQLIVNLDVDNVIFIGKENNKIKIDYGALEYEDDECNILEKVVDNVEGGIESLKERFKRYDK